MTLDELYLAARLADLDRECDAIARRTRALATLRQAVHSKELRRWTEAPSRRVTRPEAHRGADRAPAS
jgi:hypothetical protein